MAPTKVVLVQSEKYIFRNGTINSSGIVAIASINSSLASGKRSSFDAGFLLKPVSMAVSRIMAARSFR